MEETFRRAIRIRTLPRVAKMERKMCRAIKNIHTPDGKFKTDRSASVEGEKDLKCKKLAGFIYVATEVSQNRQHVHRQSSRQ